MILQLNKSQKAIIRTVKEFTKGEFNKEVILDLDKTGRFPKNIWQNASDLGFIGIHLPETVSGGGMKMTDHMLVSEAFARYDATLGSAIMLAAIGAEWITEFADDPLKEKILPDLLEGRKVSGAVLPKKDIGVIVSETESGTSLVINGEMDHVINGGIADILFLPMKKPDYGFVVVDAGNEGVAIEKQHQPLGLRMTNAAKISLCNVHIPLGNAVIMKKPRLPLLRVPLRLLIAFLATGIAQGAIDHSLVHVKGREQFGRKIANFQVLRHKLAAMELRVNQTRSITYLAAQNYSHKKPEPALAALACLSAVTTATQVTHEAIQLMGGYGYTVEYEVERFCRDAKTLQLMSQGSISLHDDIADAVIGKVR